MRKGRRSGWSLFLALLVGAIIGTVVGQHLTPSVLRHPLTLGPDTVNLYLVRVTLWIQTNLTGLIGAALGLFLALRAA